MRLEAGRAEAAPVDRAAFAAAMARFAPFERFAPFGQGPLIAAGVSGGPDSMALILLLDAWARDRGGSVLALTVDHGLRPDSAAEARQVGEWLAARGIAHTVVTWDGVKPTTGIQEAARGARYRLLAQTCAGRGILRLAVAHHADDQAETVLFRQERGSGPDGLAGMAARRSLGEVELLRPLLAWPKAALIATCEAFGQPFIEDPSNAADRYARTTLRRRLARDPAERDALLDRAQTAGEARALRDVALAALLARGAEPRPDGAVLLDPAALEEADVALRRAAVAAALRTAGGGAHPPDGDAVARLERSALRTDFRGASLAGCVIRPWQGRLLVVREAGRIGPPELLSPGGWARWDGRFEIRVEGAAGAALTIGALGRAGYAQLRRATGVRLPAAIGAALPAVRMDSRVVAVPYLGWADLGWAGDATPIVNQRFSPLWPLAPEKFTVVYAEVRIICGREGSERA